MQKKEKKNQADSFQEKGKKKPDLEVTTEHKKY